MYGSHAMLEVVDHYENGAHCHFYHYENAAPEYAILFFVSIHTVMALILPGTSFVISPNNSN